MMKKVLMVGAILLAAAVSQAASYRSSSNGMNSLTGLLGFTKTAVNFGADYEHRSDNVFGFGGYFLYSSEKKDVAAPNNQVMSFGGAVYAHLLENSHIDPYVAPGFGFHMIKGQGGQDDSTTIGPVWKIGFMYKLNPTVRMGLEWTEIVNWFTDKYAGDVNYTNVGVAFNF